jgi:hypothetical protein
MGLEAIAPAFVGLACALRQGENVQPFPDPGYPMWPFSSKRIQEIHQKDFTDLRVELDDKLFVKCSFTRCILVFSGGAGGGLTQCTISNCVWKFEGAAANTIGFMATMYHAGQGGKDLIEGAIRNIQAGELPKT